MSSMLPGDLSDNKLIIQTARSSYDLGILADFKALKNNIGTMKNKEQKNRLVLIYEKVKAYKDYQGNNIAMQRAAELCRFLIPKISLQGPVVPLEFSLLYQQVVPKKKEKVDKPVLIHHEVKISPSHSSDPIIVNPLLSLPYKNASYLLLDYLPTGFHYVIGTPALKSSGDIYHTLAYVLFAQALGFNFPSAIFAYDTSDTEIQARRAAGLAQLLGFQKAFQSVKIPSNSGQPRPRMTKLREYASTYPYYLIDQKATTLFLSKLFQKYGFENTTNLLRRLFLQAIADGPRKDYVSQMAIIDQWVETEFQKIQKAAAGKQVVIFNRRIAAGANSDQNIGEQALAKIEENLRSKGIFYWYLVADSNPKRQGKNGNETFLFNTNLSGTTYGFDQDADNKGLYKIRNILLLARLKELPHLIGIAGNTSGTLDIAAFLGLRVYCFHTFTKTRNNLYLDAQDYRVLIQHPFLSIGLPLLKTGIKDTDEESLQFIGWLESKGQARSFPHVSDMTVGIPKATTPLKYKTHAERLPFAGSLTWPLINEKRDLSGNPKLKVKTEPRFMEFKHFNEEDIALRSKLEAKQKGKAVKDEVVASHPIFDLTRGQSIPGVTTPVKEVLKSRIPSVSKKEEGVLAGIPSLEAGPTDKKEEVKASGVSVSELTAQPTKSGVSGLDAYLGSSIYVAPVPAASLLPPIAVPVNVKREVQDLSVGLVSVLPSEEKSRITESTEQLSLAKKSYGQGQALFGQNRFKEALPHYENAIKYIQSNADYYLGLADTHYCLKDDKAALQSYQKVKELAPQKLTPALWNRQGNIYFRLEHFKEAIEYCKQAVSLNPHEPIFLSNLQEAQRHLTSVPLCS